MSRLSADDYRLDAMETIETSEMVVGVHMEMWPKDGKHRPLDPVWDADDYAITVHSKPWFPMDGEGMVQAIFAQGADPAIAARALRKFANLLEGYDRHALANMGLGQRDLNYAVRCEDGHVEIVNLRQQRKDWEESEEGQAYRASQRSEAAGTS